MSKYYRLVMTTNTLAMVIALSGSLAVAATTHHVGAGQTFTTIQSAINVANNGDTVLVHNGTYVENINFNGKAITVKSENGANLTTIDGSSPIDSNKGSVVIFNSGEGSGSVLEGFKLTNGSGTLWEYEGNSFMGGGGIYCNNSSSPIITNCVINSNLVPNLGGGIFCYFSSSPTITNCTISNNTGGIGNAGGGGGISCMDNSSPMITNCIIIGNTASGDGGGIALEGSSSPVITNCSISGNTTAQEGGGIRCRNYSSPQITNCTIRNNTANDDGGGIRLGSSSSPMISNCTISGNVAKYAGGGVSCSDNTSPTIINCIITGNSVSGITGDSHSGDGGGIWCTSDSNSPKIINCTITGNSASKNGGGISANNTLTTIVNSIFWSNTAGTSGNEIYLENYFNASITITYSDIQGGWNGIGNINNDPLFVGGGDYHLTAYSPCIDTGTSSGAPSDDIDGQPRPQDGNEDGTAKYDMGADEYGAITQSSIALNSGWNLISFSLEPADTAIATVLDFISGKYVSAWAFMNGSWKVYDPANPGFSDLTTMQAGWGYWINMSESATLDVSGSTPSNSISLDTDWNLVGCNTSTSQAVADALVSIDGKYISVWAYINGAWKVYNPASPGFSDLITLEPNYGYWINTTEACTWTLP